MAINLPIVSKFVDKGVKDAEGAFGGIGKTLAKLGGVIATAFSVTAITNFSRASIDAASDLGESLNAVNVAYGDAAAAVIELGKSSAVSMGVAQTEFNAAAVRFSAFAERVVGEGGNIAGFIGDISTRAADFASVFNIDVSEALSVFQSGLSGEAEPLKRFGINLLESEVKAYALRSGLIKVGQTMTEQQKVQARYGLLMEATSKTAGDFANTSDGLANSQRILQASFTNIQATIGNALLPVIAQFVQSLLPLVEEIAPKLIEVFAQLAPVLEELIGVVPGLLDGFMPLIDVLMDIIIIVARLAVQLLPIFVSILNAILPIIAAILPVLATFLEDLITPLAPAILEIVEGFMPLIDALLPAFVQLLRTLLPVITQLLLDVFVPLAPAIISVVEAITPLLLTILPPLIDIINTLLIPALSFATAVFQAIVENGINVLRSGLTTLSAFLTPFAEGFKSVWRDISGFVKGTINGILGFIQGMVNGVVDGVNAVIGALNSIKVTIPSWVPLFGGNSFSLNLPRLNKINIPRLAEGGIVMPQPGGVLANLAEAGRPEAVIPLDRLGNMGGNQNTYNINVNAGMGANGTEIGRKIVDEIIRYERASGRVFARA